MDNFMKNLKRTIGEDFNESVTEKRCGWVSYYGQRIARPQLCGIFSPQ